MEVFQHFAQESFCISPSEDIPDEELAGLDVLNHCSMAHVLQKLFDNVSAISTSTPNSSRTSRSCSLNDSGFNDSFSSDITVSALSSLDLNDESVDGCVNTDDELVCPRLCLLSKFDNSEKKVDELHEECQNSVPSLVSDYHQINDTPYNFTITPVESAKSLLTPLAACCRSPTSDRLSSGRRLRSPAPGVERRLRHRVSLDSYLESHSEDCQSNNPLETVLSSKPASHVTTVCSTDIVSVEDSISSIVTLTLAEFAPTNLVQLIGRKMGRETVDIVSELMDHSMNFIVQKILNYVNASDLCRMCMVSQKWHSAVHSDRLSVCRKSSYISSQHLKITAQKQNIPCVNDCTKNTFDVDYVRTSRRDPLAELQSSKCIDTSDTADKQLSLAKRFWQEASKLRRDERLTKCPRCCGPSRTDCVQERATCTSVNCQYDFCTRCTSAYHGSSHCASRIRPSRRSDPCIGSRQSHRNLRRL